MWKRLGLAMALLLSGCTAQEVPLDGTYRYTDDKSVSLVMKGHAYTLCAPKCATGKWDYEYAGTRTRLEFTGPLVDFLQRTDPSFHTEKRSSEIGNIEFGYGCPCLYFGDPDGAFFQMKGVLIQEKVAKWVGR